MRTRTNRAVAACLAFLALAACSGDDDGGSGGDTTAAGAGVQGGPDVSLDDPGPNPSTSNPGPNATPSDPGPNTTTFDPGPNDTSGGPATIEGVLVLDDPAGCITLEAEGATHDLRLTGYSIGQENGSPALVDDGGTIVARPGDTVFVTGFARDEQGDCGTSFDVDSLNSVIPAAVPTETSGG